MENTNTNNNTNTNTNEFKVIDSQEEFDRRIADRIERAKNSVRKEYENYESYKAKAEKYDSDLAERDTKYQTLSDKYAADLKDRDDQIKSLTDSIALKDSEISAANLNLTKFKVANEYGIGHLADRLKGDTEAQLKKDAQELSRMGFRKGGYPSGSAEPVITDPKAAMQEAALKKLAGLN